MTKRSMSFTLLIAFCAVGVVASLAFVAVSANESNGGVVCLADADGNGTVEITELFNVIDWYFNETRCTEPDSNDWTVSQAEGENPIYAVLNHGENAHNIGPWWLSLECVNQDRGHIGVFMGTIWKEVYTHTEDTRLVVVAEIDGEVSVQTWWFVVESDDSGDYLTYAQPAPDQSPLVEQLITADSIVFTLPPHDDPHVVRFSVSGLDQHIDDSSNICSEP